LIEHLLEVHDLHRLCFFEQPIDIRFLIFDVRFLFVFRRRWTFLSWTLCTNFWNMKLGLKKSISPVRFVHIMEQK
jgi:hypothetical protein